MGKMPVPNASFLAGVACVGFFMVMSALSWFAFQGFVIAWVLLVITFCLVCQLMFLVGYHQR